MKSEYIQRLLSAIFILLGSWCLLFPHTVESLGFRPEYIIGNATSAVLMGCFGAQAVLTGVVILMSRFTAATFLVFGLVGSIPFFVFNCYFYFVRSMFTEWMLLDFIGNIGILLCGVYGYRVARRESELSMMSQ